MRLAEIATYVNEKISSSNITLDQYVTTDSLLQDKRGREYAQNLPPVTTNLIHYQPGDVLVANIRPYLKKVWFADCEGGASSDVLVLRAKNANDTTFVYALLMQDSFYDYAMKGAKGSKMPRGDKDQIMRYEFPIFSPEQRKDIGKFITDIESKIAVNRQINDNLEAMAKQLYDYWFVQFGFPNEEGKPYKSSGGKMVWNDKLKREIPEGWEVKTIGTFADVKRGSTITKAQTVEGDIKVVAAATDYSFLHNEANRSAYVITVSASGANAGFINFWREPIYASDCSTIQCEKIEETLYCYYWILHFQELLFTQQIGAAQPHVYPEHINKIPIVVPSPDILAKVKNLLVKSNQKQSEISRETESLTKQRDELLPLLMNGQVSVNYHLSHD